MGRMKERKMEKEWKKREIKLREEGIVAKVRKKSVGAKPKTWWQRQGGKKRGRSNGKEK